MVHGKSKTAQRREKASSLVQQRTIVLPLELSKADFDLLAEAARIYNRMWSSIVSWCDTNKSVNRTRMQKENYHRLRKQYPELPSQFVCVGMRDAAGAVKSWNSNRPKRKWNMKASRKALTINYDLRLMSVRGDLLTLSTLQEHKRVRTLMPEIPLWFDTLYPDRKLNAAKLILDPKTGTARIALIYRLNTPFTERKGLPVLGVDLGEHTLAMDSRGGEHNANHMWGVKRRYAHNRKTLQEKGTRSAHRRLKAMSGREKRFIRDVNHCISKQLANTPNIGYIAFEDLTYIRRQAGRNTKTGKRRRNMLHQWSFSQLQEFTTYKAIRKGIRILMVDPSYTSQRCNRCGYVDRRNRNGARFDCKRCGWSDHADHNAALNIQDRGMASIHAEQQEHTSTDRPVDRPPVNRA